MRKTIQKLPPSWALRKTLFTDFSQQNAMASPIYASGAALFWKKKEETQMQNPKGKPSIVLVVVMGGSTGNKVSSTNSSPEICLWGFNTLFQTGGKM